MINGKCSYIYLTEFRQKLPKCKGKRKCKDEGADGLLQNLSLLQVVRKCAPLLAILHVHLVCILFAYFASNKATALVSRKYSCIPADLTITFLTPVNGWH